MAPALDENGPQGMNVEAAWAAYGTGSPGVTVAYVEGGINWHLSDAASLASVVYVNWREAPVPCTGSTVATATMVVNGVTEACHTVYSGNIANYELDGSTRVNAADWAHDPRVSDANHNGVIDPEDLIASFCGPGYHPPVDPATGLRCDISGWDFYDRSPSVPEGQNDPATVDTAYVHANNQMDTLHTECPSCTILPVKAGDEALDTTDDLARAWLFAAEEGASVIVSVTADLGYSSFMRQVIDYIHQRGIIMVEASNDFDSTDHQGGMFWPHVIPGNGAVVNASGTGWTRSDLTSWGTHAMFTVATSGGSTSESSPTTGGVLGLLLSYGDKAYSEGRLATPLSGPELVQIVRATATPFTDSSPGLSWSPGAEGRGNWSMQYGYGMPNVYRAAQMIFSGQVPPALSFTSPGWYHIYDPLTSPPVPVTGAISAGAPADGFTWVLQAAPGPQPVSGGWSTIGTGSAVGSYGGTLGVFNPASIPRSFWGSRFRLSGPPSQKALPTSEQYAVTIRLVVHDTTNSTTSIDRRAVNVEHDPTVMPGFPLHVGGSIESSPVLADLQGTGQLAIVFADSNGTVRAIDPSTGSELPGWPVHTDSISSIVDLPPGISPGSQPVLAPIAVGDLFHTGSLDVVVTSVDGYVYAFDSHGRLLPGWPKPLARGVTLPSIPRPELPNIRLPEMGAVAPPVLADMTGDHQLDIIQAGWDGYLHVWRPDGTDLPGWPVRVGLPAGFTPAKGYTLEADHKLDTPPAVAYLSGPGRPALVIRSQMTEILGPGSQPLPKGFVFAFRANGTSVSGWPVELQGLLEFYGSAQEFITEGSDAPVAADVNGTGRDEVAVQPVWTPAYLLKGNGSVAGSYGDFLGAADSLLTIDHDPKLAYAPDSLPRGYPIPFTSSGSFGIMGPPGSPLDYASPGIGSSSFAAAELQPNAGLGIDQYLSVYSAGAAGAPGGAKPLAGYPSMAQGLDFLGEPVFADVTGGGDQSVIIGGDSGAVAAYTATGAQAPGFPKFTGGWVTFSPVIGDLLSNGHNDVVAGTREGYLFAWSTPGTTTTSWWRPRHDEWNTGNAGIETRPPGSLLDPHWSPGSPEASFRAPGAIWYSGEVSRYEVTYGPSGHTIPLAPSGPAGTTQVVPVPPGTTGLRVVAVGRQGNLSRPLVIGVAPATPASGYWTASADGGVYSFGDAGFHGSLSGTGELTAPVVSIVPTLDRGGYWLVGADGGVYSFGDATFYGSMAGRHLDAPVVGMAATPDGGGYWLVGADGGVYSFGGATFYGSMAGRHLDAPVVGMAATPDGGGYWLVGADGGVYSFGDATFYGSAPADDLSGFGRMTSIGALPGGYE
ncbi:MAG: hypothetical protein ACYCV1_09790 [Acidimicrobiales bacterium]